MYSCELCDFASSKRSNYNDHISTQVHIDNMCSKLPANTELLCMKCNEYVTKFKNNFRRHLSICKGANVKQDELACPVCKKEYQSRSGLFLHKRKGTCTVVNEPTSVTQTLPQVLQSMSDAIVLLTEKQIHSERQTTAIESLLTEKQMHSERQTTAIESLTDKLSSIEEIVNVLKASTVVHGNVINGNVQNVENNMNINVFLNEHCKDAMNIFDFVKSIKLNPSHLDQFVSQGYVAAMSNIMVNELNNMPITQRPLHCTDVRRQTLHVKHDDKWHQETKSTPLLLKAITVLRHACTHLISQRYPPGKNRFDPDSVQEALYFKTHAEVSGGPRASDVVYNKRNQKIVTSVCKSVKISKQDIKLAALA